MICPRCGVHNQAERGSCTRCGGSLAPAAGRGPLPTVPAMTRRAEAAAGRGRMPGQPPAAQPGQVRPAVGHHAGGRGGPAVASRAGAAAEAGPGTADIYLMSSERDTGQPAPPELPGSASGNLRGERPGRVAVGLSGA